MSHNMLLLPISIPLVAAILVALVPNKWRYIKEALALIATAGTLLVTALLFKKDINLSIPWAGFGFEFSLRCYSFSSFIILAAAIFGFLIALYSTAFLINKSYSNKFYALLLITFGFLNGAVLSDNLIVMLFFWEGLLLTLFGMIAIGDKNVCRESFVLNDAKQSLHIEPSFNSQARTPPRIPAVLEAMMTSSPRVLRTAGLMRREFPPPI